MKEVGKWCTYAETFKSQTALRKGIDNEPSDAQFANILKTYKYIYEPICNAFKRKLPISSFFRCKKLNTAIGGSKTSQHMTGEAIDIDCDSITGTTNRQLFNWILKNLSFDQLILESPDKNNNPSWVHVSFVSKEKNRKQVLKMVRKNGKSVYEHISGW